MATSSFWNSSIVCYSRGASILYLTQPLCALLNALNRAHFSVDPNVENEASYLDASSSMSFAWPALRTVALTGNGSLTVW